MVLRGEEGQDTRFQMCSNHYYLYKFKLLNLPVLSFPYLQNKDIFKLLEMSQRLATILLSTHHMAHSKQNKLQFLCDFKSHRAFGQDLSRDFLNWKLYPNMCIPFFPWRGKGSLRLQKEITNPKWLKPSDCSSVALDTMITSATQSYLDFQCGKRGRASNFFFTLNGSDSTFKRTKLKAIWIEKYFIKYYAHVYCNFKNIPLSKFKVLKTTI